MQDGARGSGGERGCAPAGDASVSGPGRARRRWSDEEKARVVRASLRPGERIGEVARRYGVSRWQLSAWRGLAPQGQARRTVPDGGPGCRTGCRGERACARTGPSPRSR